MPTSGLEETAEVTAPAVAIDIAAGPPSNRPIAWAGAFSAFLHLLLLVMLGLASFEASTPSSAPDMRLSIELADGRDTEHDMAGPVERPAAPIAKSTEEVLAAANQPRTSKLASLPSKPTPSSLPTSAATQPKAAPSLPKESAQSDSGINDIPILTTPGVGEIELSARAVTSERPQAPETAGVEQSARIEAPVARQVSEVGTQQQSVLARWVVQAAKGLQDANLNQGQLSLEHEGRQYTAFLERRAAADDMGIERVKVAITTEENGKRLRTVLQLKRLAFSHFTQLVDQWDSKVVLHDDEIEGRFHSNSEISLGDDRVAPKFLGKVTTAAWHYRMATGVHRPPDDIFRGGIETRVGRVSLPAIPGFASNPGNENTNVRSFTRDTRVTFYPDGTYGWREVGSDAPEHKQEPTDTPQHLVGSGGTTLYVRGTVRGKVVVYSPERIVVEGSLLYARDPRSSRDAEDYLGLISLKDIEIAPEKVTGPGDLEIHAAVYARRHFIVTDWDRSPGTATLWIHGSLTAGSLSATEPRYATKYDFDRRFEEVRPPGFPVTNRYELEAWDGQWREAGDNPSEEAAEPTQHEF